MAFPFLRCSQLVWQPVVEPDMNQTRFFEDQPSTLFRNGKFHKVKVVAGIVTNEMVHMMPGIFKSLLVKELN